MKAFQHLEYRNGTIRGASLETSEMLRALGLISGRSKLYLENRPTWYTRTWVIPGFFFVGEKQYELNLAYVMIEPWE
jgi:hypothetical protein